MKNVKAEMLLNKCIGNDTKGAAGRSPNCRYTKYVLWNAVSVPLLKFCENCCTPRKISLKSDNRLLSYGQQKRFLQVALLLQKGRAMLCVRQ